MLAALASADVLGVDVSQPVSVTAAQCMKTAGKSYSITRAFESLGRIDKNAPATMTAFAKAGIETDIYMFPCSFGLDAKTQLTWLQGNLTASNAPRFGMMWFDIEDNPDPACSWVKDTAQNCAYMKTLVDAALSMPYFANRTGVYTSIHEWQNTWMGSNCTVAAALPLWYPHYEQPPNPSFSDFTPFGGWTQPFMKQYADGPATCGVGTDLNWRPQ